MLSNDLMALLLLTLGYVIVFCPALILAFALIKFVFKRINTVRLKRAACAASLFLLIGIEFICLFYINSKPFVVYDKETLSARTVEKVLAYAHDRPDRFHVEEFAGVDISHKTFKIAERVILIQSGDQTQIGYSIMSIPFGDNHWAFNMSDIGVVSLDDVLT